MQQHFLTHLDFCGYAMVLTRTLWFARQTFEGAQKQNKNFKLLKIFGKRKEFFDQKRRIKTR
jgi:hypothetical protein